MEFCFLELQSLYFFDWLMRNLIVHIVESVNDLLIIQMRRNTAEAIVLRNFGDIDLSVIADNRFTIPAHQNRDLVS